jgi:integrase
MFPAPYGRVTELRDTPDEANACALELDRRRKAGLPPTDAHSDPTLGEASRMLLTRKQTQVSRKTKRKLRAKGIKHWENATRDWREGRHAATPLSLLRRDLLEDDVLETVAEHPTAGRNKLEALKASLKLAGERGARFDLSILTIEPIIVEQRKRRALSVVELEFFVRHGPPDYAKRLVLFKGTTGMRCEEVFSLTDDRVDLDACTAFVPAALCKEAVDKTVPLTPEEVTLVREQLGGLRVAEPTATAHLPQRGAGTRLVFPKAEGGRWSTSSGAYHKLVWSKAVRRAAAAWRAAHRLDERDATPFEWFVEPERDGDDGRRTITPHDLRSTAATLMRDAGMSRDDAAARLGHADAGELLDEIYDQGDRAARVARALAEFAPEGLRAALAEAAPRRSSSPAAAAGSASPEGT